MKGFENYQDIQVIKEPQPGGYICQIKDAEVIVEEGKFGNFAGVMCQHLIIYIDIVSGESAEYYSYINAGKINKKDYKGKLNFYFPIAWDIDSKRKLKLKVIDPIEKSNPNFTWDFNEEKLKGLYVGVLFYDREWEWKEEGLSGVTVTPYSLVSIDDIKNGNYKIKKDTKTKNNNSYSEAERWIPPANLPF